MDKSDILKKVKDAIAEVMKIEPHEIDEDSNIKDDLGADSMDIISLLMIIEDCFDKQIPNEDAEELTTVNLIADYIAKNLVKES